jgi:hypothetical protein
MIKQNDPRRWQERADARMVQEDHSAMANLSAVPMIKEIPHHSPVYGPHQELVELKMAFFDGIKGIR